MPLIAGSLFPGVEAMKHYVIKRLLYLIPVMLGVSIITFGLINLAPRRPGGFM
ncbi:MAG: hypothetical protein ACUVRC_06445 [Desulfotomaculales bacterium]